MSLRFASTCTLIAATAGLSCNKQPIGPAGIHGKAYPVFVAFSTPDPQGNRTLIGPAWHATAAPPDEEETPRFRGPRSSRPLASLSVAMDSDSTSPPTHELTLTRRNPASQIGLFVQVIAQRYSHAPLPELARHMQLTVPVRLESGAWGKETIEVAPMKAGDCSISDVPAYAMEFELGEGDDAEVIRTVVARARRRVDRGWEELPVLIIADYRAAAADVAVTGHSFGTFLNRLLIEGDDFQAVSGSDCREVWSPSPR